MRIKNYTSSVPAERSIMAIEMALAKAGALHVGKFYDKEGEVVGFTFQISIGGQAMLFKLPAHVDRLVKMFEAEVLRPREGSMELARNQARRTAWKILLDWVQCQVAMIQLEQARVSEVFMPYLYDAKRDKTLHDAWEERSFKGLLTEGK
jgi:hypothetical protein